MSIKENAIFVVLAFRLSIMFIIVSRYSTYIPLKKDWFRSDEDKMSTQRMIGITLFLGMLLGFSVPIFGDKEVVSTFIGFFSIDFHTVPQIAYVVVLNSVLFVGNIYYMCRYVDVRELIHSKFEEGERVSTIKTLIVAPFIEEAVYTMFLYSCFLKLGLVGDLYFTLVSSIFFGLSHMHMRWESIKDTFKNKELSLPQKIVNVFHTTKGIVVVTFLFSLYGKTVFSKLKNFWPCFVLHSYCNMLGEPKTGFKHDTTLHAIGLIFSIIILYLY